MYWNAQGGVRVTGSIGDDSLGESIASGVNVSPPLIHYSTGSIIQGNGVSRPRRFA